MTPVSRPGADNDYGLRVRTLADFLRITPGLTVEDAEALHLLVEDWHIIADLAFSDLVLWLEQEDGWVAAAHTRPGTAPMVFVEDIIGQQPTPTFGDLVEQAAHADGPVPPRVRERGQDLIRESATQIRRGGRVVAVLSVHDVGSSEQMHTRLEGNYVTLSDDLLTMVTDGTWPIAGASSGARTGTPRVGDGVIRLDVSGTVRYASPNAISAIRQLGHQGPVEGQVLLHLLTALTDHDSQLDEGMSLVAMGRAPWRADMTVGESALAVRAIPLVRDRSRAGAPIMLRNVSALRRRSSEMMTKNETVREIDHREKDNMQTVAALLRMQGRRLPEGPARGALAESERRIGVIAMIYEALSTGFAQALDFDEVARRGLQAIVDVATVQDGIESRLTGSFGMMRAEDATSVGLILSELVQNAAEHGVPNGGRIYVEAERTDHEAGGEILRVSVVDDGPGLPAGFRPSRAGLGTRIVTSMVQDLGGQIRWDDAEPTGTRVRFSARLRPLES